MLTWLFLTMGCEPTMSIVTEMDYADPGSPPPDPVTDEDGDGYPLEVDCDDTMPEVHPDARERCNGIDDNCDEAIDENDICPCEPMGTEDGFYAICEEEMAADEALDLCRYAGMELVKLESLAEQNALADLLNPFGISRWFIGLNDRDIEDEWVWSDGSELIWSRWNSGEPNDWGDGEDCVEFRSTQDSWNDIACSQAHAFVCEAF
jgi:hypothetical protein